MSGIIDMTGQRVGRLSVLALSGTDRNGNASWKCRCDCGREIIVRGYHLRSGKTKSCGCLNHEAKTAKHGASGTRLYHIWCSMKARCYNPNHKAYSDYGGRGIKICPEWFDDFMVFQEWAYSHGYREYLTIDRIDGNGDYSPNNCRWATYFEQNRNHRQKKPPEVQ